MGSPFEILLDGQVRIDDVVRYDTVDESEAIRFPGIPAELSEDEYRLHVVGFANRAKEPFRETAKEFADDFEQHLELQLHADFAITLNCAASCPSVPATVEDWEIDDPHGRPIEEVRRTRDEVEERVRWFVETRLGEVRADKRAHDLRLVRMLPSLAC